MARLGAAMILSGPERKQTGEQQRALTAFIMQLIYLEFHSGNSFDNSVSGSVLPNHYLQHTKPH